jgi:hypothetical protein
MSTLSSRDVASIGVVGAALALLPGAAAIADTPPSGQVPTVNPVAQTIDTVQRIPVVTQAYLLFGNVANEAGSAAWGTLDLLYVIQIPRSPTDSTPIQLTPNFNQLLDSSTSAASGAADQGTGRLEVVGTRVARDGRSVRIKVACVGGSSGCDGVVRVTHRRHRRNVVLKRRVRLASGSTAKYTLRA